jgi:hypothetical protein
LDPFQKNHRGWHAIDYSYNFKIGKYVDGKKVIYLESFKAYIEKKPLPTYVQVEKKEMVPPLPNQMIL